VITVHTVIRILDGNAVSVILSFAFCSGYLLWGYYVTFSEEYAFEWTIPQCVLTLRLIAVSFDVYDGERERRRKRNKKDSGTNNISEISGPSIPDKVEGNHVTKSPADVLSSPPPPSSSSSSCSSSSAGLQSNPPTSSQSQSQSSSSSSSSRKSGGRGEESGNPEAMSVIPSLLPVLAHSYFPASFLVGPQFGLKIYLDFVKEEKGFLSSRFVVQKLIVFWCLLFFCVRYFLPFLHHLLLLQDALGFCVFVRVPFSS